MSHYPVVLHVNTSQSWGGLEIYTISLVKKLNEQGYTTFLYCIFGSKIHEEAVVNGISVIEAYKQSKFSLKDINQLKNYIKKNSINIIHSHTRQDVWLCSFALFFNKYCKHVFSLYMDAPPKKDPIHRMIYSRIDAITSSSEILNQKIAKNFPIARDKIHLLRYGRESHNHQEVIENHQKLRLEYHVPDTNIIIGSMCRIDPAKGIREFVEAFFLLPPDIRKKVSFWIMGEPTLLYLDENQNPVYEKASKELYDWLKRIALTPEAESKIQLIPFKKDFFPYLSCMDVFVLATYKETYSLSVLDAMSLAIPVIGTRSGGTIEQVTSGVRGFLVEVKNPQEIANAIKRYVSNPELIEIHGASAKAWADSEHSWQQTLDKLYKIYTKL